MKEVTIQHLYSDTKGRQPSNLEPGEIALNRADKKLYATDSSGEIFAVGDDSAIIGNVPSGKTVIDVIIENEEVVAKALTTINSSCGFSTSGEFKLLNSSVRFSDATSLTEAIELIDDEFDTILNERDAIIAEKIGDVPENTTVMDLVDDRPIICWIEGTAEGPTIDASTAQTAWVKLTNGGRGSANPKYILQLYLTDTQEVIPLAFSHKHGDLMSENDNVVTARSPWGEYFPNSSRNSSKWGYYRIMFDSRTTPNCTFTSLIPPMG